MVEGHCMKCKAKREMKNARQEKTSKGANMIRGECSVCGTKMCKMGTL